MIFLHFLSDFLLDALELCKYTLTAVELSRQCQMDDCGILMKTSFGTQKDPYEEWSYSDFFSEDGIVLESQMVLPVIYELIASLLPLAGKCHLCCYFLCISALCKF